MTSPDAGKAEVNVLDDEAAASRAAAQRLVDELRTAIERRGQAHLALSGGSTAVGLYEELAQNWSAAVDWSHVHLWWGDERFVPIDHPESNIGLAYSILLSLAVRAGESGSGGQAADITAGDVPGLPIRPENVHPYQVDEALSESNAADLVAERYVEELQRFVPLAKGGLPALDVIMLGVGVDGHILSAFPGSPALEAEAPLVLAVPAPEHIGPHLPRLTINPRLFEPAGQLIVIVTGEDKAEVVARALGGRDDPSDLPARLAVRSNAVWFIDRAAAAELRR